MAFFRKKKEIPVGLWMKCPACGKMAFTKTVEENLHVCPDCDHHMKVNGPTRVKHLIDEGTFESIGEGNSPIRLTQVQLVDDSSPNPQLIATNVENGQVVIGPQRVYLPLVLR